MDGELKFILITGAVIVLGLLGIQIFVPGGLAALSGILLK